MVAESPESRKLAKRVEEAFTGVPYPSGQLTSSDNPATEAGQVADAFRGCHWSDLSYELLRNNPAALAFFSPEAFRFFLPGYLLLTLESPEEMDQSLSMLLTVLAASGSEPARLEILTDHQLLTTVDVLEAVQTSTDDPRFWSFEHAKEVILSYWADLR